MAKSNVSIHLTDGTRYIVHPSAIASAQKQEHSDSASSTVYGIWRHIENNSGLEPLLVRRIQTAVWSVAHFNPSQVTGVFWNDDSLNGETDGDAVDVPDWA